MANRWSVVCAICGVKNTFGDAKDVTYAKWKIIAWFVSTGEPKCVCDKCEYFPRKKKHEEE